MNFLRRLRQRWLDVRIEIGLTIADLLDARRKTFERRKSNIALRAAGVRSLPQVVNPKQVATGGVRKRAK